MIIPVLNQNNLDELLGVVRVTTRGNPPYPCERIILMVRPVYSGDDMSATAGDAVKRAELERYNFELMVRHAPDWDVKGPRLCILQPKPLPEFWHRVPGFQKRTTL